MDIKLLKTLFELNGKTIKDHFDSGDKITIFFEDDTAIVLTASIDEHDGSVGIEVDDYSEYNALNLYETGIISQEEYRKRLAEEIEAKRIAEEARELELLAELQRKYKDRLKEWKSE